MGTQPLFDDQFLKRVAALRFRASRRGSRAGGASAGDANVVIGFDLKDTRAYSPGDDLRALDWNALARFDAAILRRFQDSAPPGMSIYLDTTESMKFGKPTKEWHARMIAGGLGAVALASGMEVRLVQEKPHRRLAGWLAAVAEYNNSSVHRQLDSLRIRTQQKNEWILLSDLYDTESLRPWIDRLRSRSHPVVVGAIWNSADREPPAGDAEWIDSETGSVRVFTNADRAEFKKRFLEFEESWRNFCKRRGASFVVIPCTGSWENGFERIADARRQQGR
ncbi:MAG: DUF58 domain-containing protein [Planctomycetota bacterium]